MKSNSNTSNGNALSSARRTSIKVAENNKDQYDQVDTPKKSYNSLKDQQSPQSNKKVSQLQLSQHQQQQSSPQWSSSQLSSREHDFTHNLMILRRKASEEAINRAFNFISDMNNKEQVNRALLMVNDVRDRQKLVEKMLERREQIEQAREMQAINSMGPLFTKIKEKFLSAVREDESPEKQDASTPVQKLISSETLNPQNMSYTCMGKSEDVSGETFLISASPSPSHSNQVQQPQQPQQQQNQQQQLQRRQFQMSDANTPTSVPGGNANMLALNIFASRDVKDDGEKEEEDKRLRHTQLLGYLQRDQRLIVEDKNKSSGSQMNNLNGQTYPNPHRTVQSSASQSNIKTNGNLGGQNARNQANYKNLSQPFIEKQPESSSQSSRQGYRKGQYQAGYSKNIGNSAGMSEYYISSKSSSSISAAVKSPNNFDLSKQSQLKMPGISARRSSQLVVPQRSSYLFDFIEECESKRAALASQSKTTTKNYSQPSLLLQTQPHSNSCSHIPILNIAAPDDDALPDHQKPTKQKRLLKRLSTLGDLKNTQQINKNAPHAYNNSLKTQPQQEQTIEQIKKQPALTPSKSQQQGFYIKTRYLKEPFNTMDP